MENNNSGTEINIFRTSIFDRINELEFTLFNSSTDRSPRNLLLYIFLFLFLMFIINIENKFENNKSIVNSSIYSSTIFYFGEFQMNIHSYSLNQNNKKDKLNIEHDSKFIINGPSKWQFDWTKSNMASNSAWISLKLQLENNGKEFNWEFEQTLTANDSIFKLKGITNENPLNQVKMVNSTTCSLEIDISNDTHLRNQLFPRKDQGLFKFRGSNVGEKEVQSKMTEYFLKSTDCNFEASIKGNPFPVGLFRLNVIHFSFLYNLKVLMEIRGGLTQLAHSNSPNYGSSYVSNTCISSLLMQMVIDLFEGVFLLFCSFIAPSLLFSSFTLMILFKWMHISFVQTRYLLWIWKSNYLQNSPSSEIPNLISQFYKKLCLFLFVILVSFITLLKLCDSNKLYSNNGKNFQKGNGTVFVQSIPYYWYLSLFFFFIPQILNDTYNNVVTPRISLLPLHPHYIVTSLVGKAFLPIYIWGYSNSIFNTPLLQQFTKIIPITTKNTPSLSIIIFLIISFQAILYLLQYKFGPKCLIPKILRPKPYNYFRLSNLETNFEESTEEKSLEINDNIDNTGSKKSGPIRIDSLISDSSSNGSSMNFGDIELTNFDKKSKQNRKLCVICMANITVLNDFESEMCAVCTPCDHIFHQKCLKQWMNIKLECPTCRRTIPPFEPS